MSNTVTPAERSWSITVCGPASAEPTTIVGRSERIPSAESVRWYPIFGSPATAFAGYVALVSTPTTFFVRPSAKITSATSPFNGTIRLTSSTTTRLAVLVLDRDGEHGRALDGGLRWSGDERASPASATDESAEHAERRGGEQGDPPRPADHDPASCREDVVGQGQQPGGDPITVGPDHAPLRRQEQRVDLDVRRRCRPPMPPTRRRASQ